MQEIQIGQAKYIQCGDHLYHYSEEAADAASKADWARGVLTENNVWLTPDYMPADLAEKLLTVAKDVLAEAEVVLSTLLCHRA